MSNNIVIGVSLAKREVDLIEAICARSGRNKSQVVRYIVKRYFEQMQDGLTLVHRCLPEIALLDVLSKEAP